MARDSLIKIRRGAAATWTSANPTLAAGELGWESDTNKLKIGDGSTAWTGLAYFAPSGAPSGSAGGDLAGSYPNPTVAKIHETGGPTALTIGTVTDGEYLRRSGTTLVSGVPSGTGAVSTDGIWDAAGDLAVGTGADTAAKLSLGASGKVPASNGSTLAYVYPPGYEFDYVENTAGSTAVTATTDATAVAYITGNSVSYDGSTSVKIEVWIFNANVTTAQAVLLNLYDGSTDLGRIGNLSCPAVTANSVANTIYGVRFLTPTNTTHTYSIRAWKTGGTANLVGNTGGTATAFPAWYRITKA